MRFSRVSISACIISGLIVIIIIIAVGAPFYTPFFLGQPVDVREGPPLEKSFAEETLLKGESFWLGNDLLLGTQRFGGNSFVTMSLAGKTLSERSAFQIKDQYVTCVFESEWSNGYFLATQEYASDFALSINDEDGTVLYSLFYADAATSTIKCFEQISSKRTPCIFGASCGDLLVSWRSREGDDYLSRFDPLTLSLLECREADYNFSDAVPIGDDQFLCRGTRSSTKNQSAVDCIVWLDANGAPLDCYDCLSRGFVNEICVADDKAFVLLNNRFGRGSQLMTIDLLLEEQSFSEAHFYAMPTFTNNITYSGLSWDDTNGLRVQFSDIFEEYIGTLQFVENGKGLEVVARRKYLDGSIRLFPGAILETDLGTLFAFDNRRGEFVFYQ